MTDKQNTGGPAFPSKQKALMIKSEYIGIASEYEIETNGMTLRDYFAAKAMQGIQARSNWSVADVAATAYLQADAMLKERSK